MAKQDTKTKEKDSTKCYTYAVTMLVQILAENEQSAKDKLDKESGFLILIALKGILYEIDETCTISMRDDGVYGIGSGSKYAIGALQAGADWNTALTIAEKNDIYTAQPFIYRSQVKV